MSKARNVNLSDVDLALRTGEETINAADPRQLLDMIDPDQSLFKTLYIDAATKSDSRFVQRMATEKVSCMLLNILNEHLFSNISAS